MIDIGFTGTRSLHKVSANRLARLRRDLPKLGQGEGSVFRHGDCYGADAYAHELAVKHFDVEIHPSNLDKQTAHCENYTRRHEPKAPLDRNRDIVALPTDPNKEVLRSGTWATIRYARKLGRPIYMF